MDPVVIIGFWSAAFLVSHFILSSEPIRPKLIAAVGEWPFRGIYSAVALGTFIPLVVEFARHKHAGAMLWYLRDVPPLRSLVWLMMLAALILFTAGLITPSPAGMAGAAAELVPRGELKLTRHPGFVAFTLFGLAHMIMNGWAGDLLFFATFPILGILGGFHQDARKAQMIGEPYRRFVAATSFFPGAALLSGRQRWTSADTPWRTIAIGAAITIVLVAFHPMLFGGHPLG